MNARNKVVVITGAASGIGRALAFEFAQHGARLMLADLDAAGLKQVADTLREAGYAVAERVCDCGSEADILALAAATETAYGGADIVVNNAGVALVSTVERASTADAHWLMNINFWGVVHGCRAFLPQLRRKPEAMLVNVSSIFAMISMPSQGYYNAAKAAVRAFSDALREELSDSGVGVLCVHPGGIKTNIANRARVVEGGGFSQTPEQMRRSFNEEAAITTAESAAQQIVRAIGANRTRLLIGRDAKLADLLFRFAPAKASHWVSSLARRRLESSRSDATAGKR